MKRREFIKGASAVAATSAAGLSVTGCADSESMPNPAPEAPIGPDGKRIIPWQNWSGYRHCLPSGRSAPKDEESLATLLKNAKSTVRPVGAGHSFSELVPTEGQIISLRHFNGLQSYDSDKLTATFGAGTKLSQVGEPLNKIGQALANMPDVDEQTLAGAMSTGTHGTGEKLGALHSYLAGLRLVTPTGEIIDCSRDNNADLFDAARVSIGSLGVITQCTMQNVVATKMKRRTWLMPLEQAFEEFDQNCATNHSFEMYLAPHMSYALGIAINPTDEPLSPRGEDPDNNALLDLKMARDLTGWWPGARRRAIDFATSSYATEENVDHWYRIFPSERAVRNNEMEYHFDREHVIPTLKKVITHIEKHHHEVFYPIEVRVVNGEQDNAWLSPFYKHASASIAIHRYFKEDPLPLFQSTEPFFKAIGGRPHWGKMNTLDKADFARLYPKWNEFMKLRAELDPKGTMLNPYLRQLFS